MFSSMLRYMGNSTSGKDFISKNLILFIYLVPTCHKPLEILLLKAKKSFCLNVQLDLTAFYVKDVCQYGSIADEIAKMAHLFKKNSRTIKSCFFISQTHVAYVF